MIIERLTSADDPDWLRLRTQLWPDSTTEEHRLEMATCLAESERCVQFIARSNGGEAMGFAEASIRTDHVNGTTSSPVAFLEGLYVAPGDRRQGAARSLVAAVADWARTQGCSELASDTDLDNTISRTAHARLGFRETERVVYFNMALEPQRPD